MLKLSPLLLLVLYIHNSSCFVDDLDDAGKLVWQLYSIIDGIILNSNNSERFNHIFIDGNVGDQEMRNQMNKIFRECHEIERSIYSKEITDTLNPLLTQADQRAAVFSLQVFIQSIDTYYKKFKRYMNREIENSDDAMKALALKIIGDVEGAITLIRKLIMEKNPLLLNYKNIIEAIAAEASFQRDELCDSPQLIATFLVQLFRMVLIAEIKANFMLLIASIHRFWQRNGWHEMILFSEALFGEHIANHVNVFTQNMIIADSMYLRACDPVNYIWTRDENFYELETIQTELYRYTPKPSESDRCSDAWFIKQKEYVSREQNNCSHTGCHDLGAVKICLLRSDLSKYHFVNSTKLGALGKNIECLKDNVFEYDGACVCNCSGIYNKISLSIIESRKEMNWVITGLRFIRKHGVLHIQPREAQLEANGYISPGTQRWIHVSDNPEVHTIEKHRRVFFLDDLHLPPYHVLTGIKLNKVIRENVKGFAIQIFGAPFNYRSGRCVGLQSVQVPVKALDTYTGPRIEFSKVPSNYVHLRYTPNPAVSGFVSLETLDLSTDFGQSTVPFFDAAPIVPSPPSALGGVGLFHKGANGSAGFISLRLFGIRYSKYLLDFQREAIVDGKVLFDSQTHH